MWWLPCWAVRWSHAAVLGPAHLGGLIPSLTVEQVSGQPAPVAAVPACTSLVLSYPLASLIRLSSAEEVGWGWSHRGSLHPHPLQPSNPRAPPLCALPSAEHMAHPAAKHLVWGVILSHHFYSSSARVREGCFESRLCPGCVSELLLASLLWKTGHHLWPA